MEILRRRYPELWYRLVTETEANNEVRVLSTDEGNFTLEVTKNGKRLLLHSKKAPVKEGERFVNFLKIKEGQVLILFGFGLGYHLEPILSNNQSITLVVIEPNLDILHTAMKVRDLSQLLYQDRLLIFSRCEECFNFLSIQPPLIISLVFYPPYLRFLEEEAKKLKENFTSFISKKNINNATLKRFDRLWTKNTFKNAYFFFSLPGISALRNKLNGMPVCVVCAGPSLENDIPILSEIKSKIFIIAVDTVVKPLIKRGIIPDFIVTVDPQFINSLWMSGSIFNEIESSNLPVLVSEPSVYPTVLKNYPGLRVICSSVFSPGRFVEKFTESKGNIAAGGSVAVSAYDFARICGADPILLLGLDLCYSGGKTHLSGSFVQDYIHYKQNRLDSILTFFHKYIKNGAPVIICDKNGRNVFSDRRLLMYKGWFETHASKKITINAGSGGLSIKGIKNMSLNEIIAKLKLPDNNIKDFTYRNNFETVKNKLTYNFQKENGCFEKYGVIFDKMEVMKNIKDSLSTQVHIEGLKNFLAYSISIKQNLKILKTLSNKAEKMIKKCQIKPGLRNRLLKEIDNIDAKILSFTQENQLLSMVLQSPISSIMEGQWNADGENGLRDSIILYSSIRDGTDKS